MGRWPLAFAALIVFLSTSFSAGWNRAETDFPNYYTAAVLVRKGAPLHKYYEWPWFQRQMNYAGVENQLGGYIPQTPLTMLPMLPLTKLKVQEAKRIWLLLNLGFLLASFGLLSRLAHVSIPAISLVAFAGFGTLHANVLLGQYYIFLLFLLVLSFCCLRRKLLFTSGVFFGMAFALKLYGGPFLLYFVAKRLWKPVIGMAIAALIATVTAIAMFGWSDLMYFSAHILPRALQGETLDPYNTGNGTLATLLRRTLVFEPELNPHPVWNAPGLFFFLQPFVTLLILLLPLLAVRRSNRAKRDFAFICVALLLASPNTASYTFVLLLLPVALLLEGATTIQRAILTGCYVLLTFPMHPAWSWLFPKVWLLLILLVFVARAYRGLAPTKEVALAIAASATIASAAAWSHTVAYRKEPGRQLQRVVTDPGAIYSSSPTVLRSGIVYESIGRTHYVLRWMHDDHTKQFAFAGEAFNPVAESPDGPIQFELVSRGASKGMLLDVLSGEITPSSGSPMRGERESTISPDGEWLAYTAMKAGSKQIWLHRTNGGSAVLLTGGNCNNYSPAWDLDSLALIFASDCDRGIGLPALFRLPLNHVVQR